MQLVAIVASASRKCASFWTLGKEHKELLQWSNRVYVFYFLLHPISIRPLKIQAFLSKFQVVFDKIACICTTL